MVKEKKADTATAAGDRVPTGIGGLDEILHGGLIPGRGYVVRGGPGAGKTLFGLHFLKEGVARGEASLLVTLEENLEDLALNAASVGLDLDGIDVLDLSPGSEAFGPGTTYDVFAPEEVESEDVAEAILDAFDEHEPERIFMDPITVLRHLTPDPYQFRKQVHGLVGHTRNREATILMTSQPTAQHIDEDLQFVTDGSIELSYGDDFRSIAVPKFRGSSTRSGEHSFEITDAGIRVYPDLEPGVRTTEFTGAQASSGIEEVDALLHGGLERGTTTIVSGPTGAGKTTLAAQFAKEAARRGERSSLYLFEENEDTFLARTEAIGTPVYEMMEEGTLTVQEVETLARSPQEIAQNMREDVEEDDTSLVVVDGIRGYQMAVGNDPDELAVQLQGLVRYLKNQGVTVILTDETAAMGGAFQATGSHVSYLADNIVVLRYVELEGELRKLIGVLKKRASDFERQLREMDITSEGIQVGDPLDQLRGVLTGTPETVGKD